jgi:NAD(P)-dependent dehydrogenase (short-subunit alcohol dehydrogenase family)
MTPQSKIWLVTGASSGLGKALAAQLLESGYTVYATFRKEVQALTFESEHDRAHSLVLDVDDTKAIKPAIDRVMKETGGRLDVLVNNAGYGFCGAIEEASEQDVRGQMETNFFGAYFVTQAVLPYMRAQGHGTILQISSQAGIKAAPGLGVYNASKFALEGFSEALAQEVAPLGIRVSLIEPGPFRTEWAGAGMKYPAKEIQAYDATAGRVRNMLKSYSGQQPGSPEKAAKLMIAIAEADKVPLHLPLGASALTAVKQKIEWLKTDYEAWEQALLDTDY